MTYRIYSKTHPEGVLKDLDSDSAASLFTTEMVEAVERDGVYRGGCPCCDKRIVIRLAGERSTMSAGDEHFLLHGGASNDG